MYLTLTFNDLIDVDVSPDVPLPFPDRIAQRLAEIQQLWSSLEEAARAKGAKLAEASEQQQFNRSLEDMDLWMSELEGQLMSEDYGKVCSAPQQELYIFLESRFALNCQQTRSITCEK